MNRVPPSQSTLVLVFAAALVCITGLLYLPGLSGGFLLDDVPNLSVIARLPAEPGLADLLALAGEGVAGPLGRPLAMFSFLLQHNAWPEPFGFKLVNLLIHLVNGLLVALVCHLVLRIHSRQPVSVIVPGVAALIWLAHPIQVSTVLYVVQRMTSLSATFTLAGMALYLAGRLWLNTPRHRLAMVLMIAGVIGGALLGTLTKETGVLLLAYLAVLEFTLFAAAPPPAALPRLRRWLIFAPVAVGFLAFCAYVPTLLDLYQQKPFSLLQRTLTQFPVLLAYLVSIALLLPTNFGLFHDDFPLVENLADDPWVLPFLLVVLLLLAMAVRQRHSKPWLAFAILWFFAGHSVESTVLPMELYFEHRNYLPLLGPALTLVVLVQRFLMTLPQARRGIPLLLAGGALGWMLLLGFWQTRLWGDSLEQAFASVQQHPRSPMAQSNLVAVLGAAGRYEEAFYYHAGTIADGNDHISAYVRWLEFGCLLNGLDYPEDADLQRLGQESSHGYDVINMLNNLVSGINQGFCTEIPLDKLRLTFAALQQNPAYAISHPDLYQLNALLEAGAGNFATAAALAARSHALRPDARVALARIAWLQRAGDTDTAQVELRDTLDIFAREIAADGELVERANRLRQELGL